LSNFGSLDISRSLSSLDFSLLSHLKSGISSGLSFKSSLLLLSNHSLGRCISFLLLKLKFKVHFVHSGSLISLLGKSSVGSISLSNCLLSSQSVSFFCSSNGISLDFSSVGNLLRSSSVGLSLSESSFFGSLSSSGGSLSCSFSGLGISFDLGKSYGFNSLSLSSFSSKLLLSDLSESNLLSVDSLGSLQSIVVNVMGSLGVTEALLLESWGKVMGIESVFVTVGSLFGMLKLEFSRLINLSESKFLSIIRCLLSKDTDSIAIAFIAIGSAPEDFLWWLFFTEALSIKGINLSSPLVFFLVATHLLSNMLGVEEESRSLLPSIGLSR
jgi:hypothetical protein